MLEALLANIRFVPGVFDDDRVYDDLERTLAEFDERAGRPLEPGLLSIDGARVLPADHEQARRCGTERGREAEVRIVIEKPFGYDLASARELNGEVLEHVR